MSPGVPGQATRIPSWALASGLVLFAGATYGYVLKNIGSNLTEQLEVEAARQDAIERRQQQPAAARK
jgi:hypothetical protein